MDPFFTKYIFLICLTLIVIYSISSVLNDYRIYAKRRLQQPKRKTRIEFF